jgi:hypothetical protein
LNPAYSPGSFFVGKMKKVIIGYTQIFFLLSSHIVFSQNFYRLSADFTIKQKNADGSSSLTIGKVYYDKNYKEIVYDISFPEKEIWVTKDTSLYKFVDKKFVNRQTVPSITEFSIFHLSLNGSLSNFGLESSPFTIFKVEKENGMVLTTWAPPAKAAKIFGKVVVSQKEKKLYGVAIFNAKDQVMNKQFYKDYDNTSGIEFPKEIVQISYINGKESYQVTTYSNIIVDDYSEEEMYNYPLTAY